MSPIDVDALLQEITPEAPSGENLEYDPTFLAMEQAAQGKPEKQMGDETIPAEPPNWQEVKQKALELAGRTKDLRVGMCLARALVRTDGMPGLRDSLAVLRGYVQQHWDSVHPQLDPDDANDATTRVNSLVPLRDPETMLYAVREIPLVRSATAGVFSYADVLIARGDLPTAADKEAPTRELINGAFSEVALEDLQAIAEACAEARETAIGLEADVTERAGVSQAADLSALPSLLGQLHEFLSEQLAARGVGVASAQVEGGGEADPTAADSGAIRSRDDVVRSLDRISKYYEVHEPASPIPLLMERAAGRAFTSAEDPRGLVGFVRGLTAGLAVVGLRKESEFSDTRICSEHWLTTQIFWI
jgi:type VI secretion system protein ImpA